jgi:hypothetical protein
LFQVLHTQLQLVVAVQEELVQHLQLAVRQAQTHHLVHLLLAAVAVEVVQALRQELQVLLEQQELMLAVVVITEEQ